MSVASPAELNCAGYASQAALAEDQLLLLVGLPGAGKSSFCALLPTLFVPDTFSEVRVHCFDEVEQSLAKGDQFDPDVWRQARARIMAQLAESVQASKSSCDEREVGGHRVTKKPTLFVLDDNFYLRSMRKPYFQLARTHGLHYKTIAFDIGPEECKRRNAQREGRARVPDFTIDDMAGSMEWPVTTPGAEAVASGNATWEKRAKALRIMAADLEPPSLQDGFVDTLAAQLRTFIAHEPGIPSPVDEEVGREAEQQPASHGFEQRIRKLVAAAMAEVADKDHKKTLAQVLNREKQNAVQAGKTSVQSLKTGSETAFVGSSTEDVYEEVCAAFRRRCQWEIQNLGSA